jgi:nitroreductase
MFNDTSSLVAYLESRRSARPRDLVAPGPDADQLRRILAIAARTPDHGKLHPWRFVHVGADRREAFAGLLERAFRADNPDARPAQVEAARAFAFQAPCLVVALSCPVREHKIPVWEQELSCGAACMNLLHAAAALGFGGGWVTGWAAYSPIVRDAFGGPEERIAGFLFLGTPGAPLEERSRPAADEVVREWDGR